MTLYGWTGLGRYAEETAHTRLMEQARLLLGTELPEDAAIDALMAELAYGSNPTLARYWRALKDPAYNGFGDGSTDDTAAAALLLTAAEGDKRPWYAPQGTYPIDAGTLDSSTNYLKFLGDGDNVSRLTKRTNGDFMTLSGHGVQLRNLDLYGNNLTGRGVVVASAAERFKLINCLLQGFTGVALEFGNDAGQNCLVTDCEIFPKVAGDTVVKLGADASAMRRRFSKVTMANGVIEVGAVNDVQFDNCSMRNITMTSSSALSLQLVNCIVASLGGATTFTGTNTIVVGCKIAGDVTLDENFSNSVYVGNRDVSLTVHATALGAAANNLIISDHLISSRGAPVEAAEYRVVGTKVVGAQGAAVADAAGGATVDAEARTALNALLARLRTHGLIAT
jgi:hypothetical protein